MSVDSPVTLRRLRPADATAVRAAFNSNADMARQGDVSTLSDAERYISRLGAADSPHEAWAAGFLYHHGPSVVTKRGRLGTTFREGPQCVFEFAWLPKDAAAERWRLLGLSDGDF